jgi:GDP-mannose transporter
MVINCAVSAGYILYMRIVIRKVEFADFDSVYYNNTLATPVMAILSLLTENWAEFASDYFGTGPLVAERNALFLGMLASSIAAFAISYSTAWSVRVASSTTYSMVGALNKLPVAASGIIFFAADRKAANIGNVMSIMVAFISGIVYSIASIRQKQKKTIEETLLAPGDSVNMRDLK